MITKEKNGRDVNKVKGIEIRLTNWDKNLKTIEKCGMTPRFS